VKVGACPRDGTCHRGVQYNAHGLNPYTLIEEARQVPLHARGKVEGARRIALPRSKRLHSIGLYDPCRHPAQEQYTVAQIDRLVDVVGTGTKYLASYRQMIERAAHGGLPPFGIHILLGETAPQKARNAARNIAEGRTHPVQVFCRKPR